MNDSQKPIDKIKYILIQISKGNVNEEELIEILNHSEFIFNRHWNYQTFPNAYNLDIRVLPDIYTKCYNKMRNYSMIIKERINNSTKLIIDVLKIIPDYERLEMVYSIIQTINTPWEEINLNQQKLITDFERSTNSLDFQNIGNTSRTIMNKLANEVFDLKKHKPKDPKIEV